MNHELKLSLLLLSTFTLMLCKNSVNITVITKHKEIGDTIQDFTLANYGFVPYG